MKKYMFIFHVAEKIEMGGETGASVMKWYEENGASMADSGNPFNPDSEALVKGGVVEKGSDTAAGYTIMNAENLEAAIELAKSCPFSTLPGCSVKVYETMPM